MKKILSLSFLVLGLILLSGCSNGNNTTRQSAYYDGGTDDSNIVYGPIFTNYEGCKNRAIDKEPDAYNNYVFCAKNRHDSIDGTPICEEAVRSRAPFERSMTFDNYK